MNGPSDFIGFASLLALLLGSFGSQMRSQPCPLFQYENWKYYTSNVYEELYHLHRGKANGVISALLFLFLFPTVGN